MSQPGAVVVSCHWRDSQSELAFVIRSIAGAATRCLPVSVLVPGTLARSEPDGAFDLEGMGDRGDLHWLAGLSPDDTVFVDELTPEVATLLAHARPRAVLYLSASADDLDPTWQRLHLLTADTPLSVQVHVPVNPLAQLHRHHGFGFTGYQLVLSDRTRCGNAPPPAAAWVSAAFSDADVVVVEDGIASAWRGRALRGSVSVDTRMDLWRLVAHANACIDLAPGPHIARECIEALRFGTPIIVPESSEAGAAHALAGGGATFADELELLEAVATFGSDTARSEASRRGRRYADAGYGDAGALVTRLKALLAEV